MTKMNITYPKHYVVVKENLRGVLFWQRCPACGHISTPDCEGHMCHRCGQAKYVDDELYLVRGEGLG